MTLPPQLEAFLSQWAKLRHAYHEDPARDWLVLVGILLALLLASILWNVFFFFSVVQHQDLSGAAPRADTEASSPIEAAEALFIKRAEERAVYEASGFVDPSR